MKIFIEGSHFSTPYQGTYTYLSGILHGITIYKPEIKIILGLYNDSQLPPEILNNPSIELYIYRRTGKLNLFLFEIPAILKNKKISKAIFQYIIPPISFNKCSYYPVIHDILFMDYPEYFSKYYRLIRIIFFYFSAKRSKKIITVSEYSKKRISQNFKIKSKNIFVVPNAVPETFIQHDLNKIKSKEYIFKKYNIKNFVLYVSRFEPRKNHSLILKSKVLNQYDHIVFIGHNTFDQNLEDLKTKAIWLEGIENSTLLEFYNACELFIYPSFAEGFGIPPLEAGAMKVPVVCSNATAMEDFSFFNKTFFNPTDLESFEKAIEIAKKQSENELEEIRKVILNKYNWVTNAEILVNNLNL